jgi:hypothetical protein
MNFIMFAVNAFEFSEYMHKIISSTKLAAVIVQCIPSVYI